MKCHHQKTFCWFSIVSINLNNDKIIDEIFKSQTLLLPIIFCQRFHRHLISNGIFCCLIL